jgi:ribosome-associated protein
MNKYEIKTSITNNAAASFSRSGGPGGQNVNKVNTKVTLRIKVNAIDGLSERERERLLETLSGRITAEGEIVLASQEERSLHANQRRAYSRLEAIIVNGARLPKHRRPTQPSAASREARLASKKRRSLVKRERSRIEGD